MDQHAKGARNSAQTLTERRSAKMAARLERKHIVRFLSNVKWLLFPVIARAVPRALLHIHESPIAHVFWNALQRNMIVVDAGAHMGVFTVLAARRVGPGGRVVAFEPEPRNYARLLKATRGMRNVTCVRKALSDQTGESDFYIRGYHGSHSIVPHTQAATTLVVETITLDRFFRDSDLQGIDFVKIDIEGAELLAIHGMDAVMRSNRRPTILCEVHPPNLPEDVAALLETYDYCSQMLDAEFTAGMHVAPVHLLACP